MINVGIIGTGGQGIVNMKRLFNEPDVRITALCDVNWLSDYGMFYYGGTAGLKPALDLVRDQYGQPCLPYHDYRYMLETEDIDAVLLATPDHSHAMIALDVIAKGKHLYCEQPLCRTVYESRVVTEAARKAGVATQLGTFGHSGEYIRRAYEWIWDGAIGDVYEVHAWTKNGARRWSQLTDRPGETPPVPDGFDWERWLEPVPRRPYHPAYAPVRWRAWWQFGSGAIGDSACRHLAPAFWGLKLDQAATFSVEASSHGVTEEVCPLASIVHFHVPARADMGPVRITWYEGGMMPPRPPELVGPGTFGDDGVLLIGTEGAMGGGDWSMLLRIFPEAKGKAFKRPAHVVPRVRGYHREWLDACKGQGKASTNFDYGGPLTEFALMGNVALRAGRKLEFDWKNMTVTNSREANKYLKPRYRRGWKI
jgi:predicted dehydrogenase